MAEQTRKMIAADGKVGDVPFSKVEAAMAAGLEPVDSMIASDGKQNFVRQSRQQDALGAGLKFAAQPVLSPYEQSLQQKAEPQEQAPQSATTRVTKGVIGGIKDNAARALSWIPGAAEVPITGAAGVVSNLAGLAGSVISGALGTTPALEARETERARWENALPQPGFLGRLIGSPTIEQGGRDVAGALGNTVGKVLGIPADVASGTVEALGGSPTAATMAKDTTQAGVDIATGALVPKGVSALRIGGKLAIAAGKGAAERVLGTEMARNAREVLAQEKLRDSPRAGSADPSQPSASKFEKDPIKALSTSDLDNAIAEYPAKIEKLGKGFKVAQETGLHPEKILDAYKADQAILDSNLKRLVEEKARRAGLKKSITEAETSPLDEATSPVEGTARQMSNGRRLLIGTANQLVTKAPYGEVSNDAYDEQLRRRAGGQVRMGQ